jgi:hypothetical protein
MTTEIKMIALLVGVIALLGGGVGLHHLGYSQGDTAGSARVQLSWDADKAQIQAVAAQALATATKQRDDALQANQVLHDQYEQRIAGISADSADFAKRLRNAQAIIAAGSRPVPAGNSGQDKLPSGAADSAQQLGQLVTLTTKLRAECLKNDADLDDLYESLNRQPHTLN